MRKKSCDTYVTVPHRTEHLLRECTEAEEETRKHGSHDEEAEEGETGKGILELLQVRSLRLLPLHGAAARRCWWPRPAASDYVRRKRGLHGLTSPFLFLFIVFISHYHHSLLPPSFAHLVTQTRVTSSPKMASPP